MWTSEDPGERGTVAERKGGPERAGRGARDFLAKARQAFAEFLTVPSLIVLGYFALAALTTALDGAEGGWLAPAHRFLRGRFFRTARSTGDLLGTIAGGITTVTSITFSLLLLAVQQSAASMTHQVFDQFLRRRLNQAYFGYFVGLALFAMIILATVDPPFNPVFGATAALLLTFVAMFLVILIIYSTIDQMRPVAIIEEIHNRLLDARRRQHDFLRNVRRSSTLDAPGRREVRAEADGFLTRIDVDAIAGEASRREGRVEVDVPIVVGGFVAFGDAIAEIRAESDGDAEAMEPVVRGAMPLARQRDLDTDPAYGLEQLHVIAWSAISTAKQNPAPGLLTIRALRDILARWSAAARQGDGEPARREPAPVVYRDDVPEQLLDVFESLAVAASESMQHQSLAEVLRAFAVTFERLDDAARDRVAEILLRLLSSLGDQVLTRELEASLTAAAEALAVAGHVEVAGAIRGARDGLKGTIGTLQARSTRAQAAGGG